LVKWEKQTQYKANTKPKQTQFKPNSKPIYRGVAFGEAGSDPIYRGIDSLNRTYYLYSSFTSFDSAKMAQYKHNWNVKNVGREKFNLLKYKQLNVPDHLCLPTGTPFAHLNRWNFLYTDYTQ